MSGSLLDLSNDNNHQQDKFKPIIKPEINLTNLEIFTDSNNIDTDNHHNTVNLKNSKLIEMQQQHPQQTIDINQQTNDNDNNNNSSDDNDELLNHGLLINTEEKELMDLPEDEDIDHDYSKQFFIFKQHVKSKRKATFCCIFSIGSLILCTILLSAPLSTQMSIDWQLYRESIHTQCIITNKTYLNGTKYYNPSFITKNYNNYQYNYNDHINVDIKSVGDNNSNNNDNNYNDQEKEEEEEEECIYIYQRKDGNNFTNKCLTMHETQSCSIPGTNQYVIDHIDECYFYNNDNCEGTMINTLMLQRNNNMFVILLAIGTVFAMVTLFSAIYGIYLIHSVGIYCSVMSIQKDDDQIFKLMERFQKEQSNRNTALNIMDQQQRNRRNQRHRERLIDDYDSSLYTITSSATIHSSTMHSTTIHSSSNTMSNNSTIIDDLSLNINDHNH